MKYDFSGWATKNDLRCADGRVIRRGAFKINDGKKVPLIWNHEHNNPSAVLGHAILENRDEGVYAFCSFNNTVAANDAKEAVVHGDIDSLSIYANHLQQDGPNVLSGVIRELSLVHAGKNPGAFIESVFSHGEPMDDYDEEAIIYCGETIDLSHAEEMKSSKKKDNPEPEKKKDPTIQEVLDSLTDDQKAAVGMLLAGSEKEKEDDKEMKRNIFEDEKEKEDDKEMKHNIFEGKKSDPDAPEKRFLSHDDMKLIFTDAKRLGSLKDAVQYHMEEGVLQHAEIPTTGMTLPTGTATYGIKGIDMLFPDYKTMTDTPEMITRKMDWVAKVMSRVHHIPFTRVKSVYANITEDEARARGYIKGKLKKEEVFSVLKRTTSPQTVYKKQKLDRDDIIDITDFNVVAWIRSEMRMMLDEELARAFLIGDGRLASSDDKISEEHIRPVATDVDLMSIKYGVQVAATDGEDVIAKETIKAAIRARKRYKGKGTPDFFTTEDVLTEMLLLEDGLGHRMYKTEAELATALRVREIITVEPMEDHKITVDTSQVPLIGLIVNLDDYYVGADKGGEINSFEDFDIDYNQQKYLIETRVSASLAKPFSAIVLYLNKTAAAGS